MRKILAAMILTGATLLGAQARAQDAAAGDPKHGQVLADTCMGCHGIAGYRNAYPSYRVPKLGGQQAEYLFIALQGYKNKTRAHKTMQAQAGSLSDQDLRDIAAFLASEGPPKTGPAVNAPGKDKTATCAACHGEVGISAAPNWPNLAGQYRDYIEQALHEYKSGERKDPVMGAQAAGLSDADIKAVAAYFSAQSGLFTARYK